MSTDRSSKKEPSFWFFIAVACFMIGFILPMIVSESLILSYHARSEPEIMRCAELADLKMSDNRYVTMVDAFPHSFLILDSKSDRPPWNRVVVPSGPTHGREVPDLADVRVVVTSTRVKNEEDFLRELSPGEITGVLHSKGQYHKSEIAVHYPGVDFRECWTLVHGDKPAGIAGPLLGLIFLLILIAVGVVWIFVEAQTPLGPYAAGLIMTGPLVWAVVGLAVLLRGKQWVSRDTLTPLYAVCGAGLLMVGGLLYFDSLSHTTGVPFLPLFTLQFGSILLGFAVYFLLFPLPLPETLASELPSDLPATPLA